MDRLRRLVATRAGWLALVIAFLPELGGQAAQSPAPQRPQQSKVEGPSFEVASVRPSRAADPSLSPLQARPDGSVVATNIPLRGLITFAYGLELYQTIEPKSSLLDQRFDVTAKAPGPVSLARTAEVGPLNLMMQHLLADRFRLVVRWETRPQAGYALVRARSDGALGPHIRPSDLECPRKGARPPGDSRGCMIFVNQNEFSAAGHRMADIARFLSSELQRPVVDRTGLAGSFEARMTYDSLELAKSAGRIPPGVTVSETPTGVASLFTAIQEEWGLELESQRVEVPTLIVERVEEPSPN